jgi:Ran GTPase-activating protein (RanGAP) involved in mRNA processing and transport
LSFNQIGSNGVTALLDALTNNTCLQYLNISGNSIDDSVSEKLINTLPFNVSLKELDLSLNNLQDKGFISLMQAISNTSCQISVLKIVNNSITDQCMEEVAEALKVNRVLRLLDLSNNSIGDAGVTVMIDALQGNSSLEEIYLLGNKVTSVGLAYLAQALVKGNKLANFMIDLRENSVDSSQTTQDIQIAVNRGVIYVT